MLKSQPELKVPLASSGETNRDSNDIITPSIEFNNEKNRGFLFKIST